MPETTLPADGMTDYGLIELDGTTNTRDQGGMETVTGQRVVPRKLIRSDDLHRATDNDIHILTDQYELKVVIDLRTDVEREGSPDPVDRMPGVKFVDLSVLAGSAVGLIHEHSIKSLWEEFQTMKKNPIEVVSETYPLMLLGEPGKKAWRAFFDILLEQEEGSILWHCSEGKDRTGMASLLILHVLGVPPKTIMEDYMATNLFARKKMRRLAEDFEKMHIATKSDEALIALVTANEDYMKAAMEAVDEKYGSLDSYLDKEIGITPEKRAALCAKYLF